MPTYDFTDEFLRQYLALSPAERARFKTALRRFIQDLRANRFRKGLRVKAVRGRAGQFEMTWAPDGRAIYRYGAEVRPGDKHVIWLAIGGHEIFDHA